MSRTIDDAGGASAAQTKFFEQKIEQYQQEFREKELEIEALRREKRTGLENENKASEELMASKREQEKQALELQKLVRQAEQQQR